MLKRGAYSFLPWGASRNKPRSPHLNMSCGHNTQSPGGGICNFSLHAYSSTTCLTSISLFWERKNHRRKKLSLDFLGTSVLCFLRHKNEPKNTQTQTNRILPPPSPGIIPKFVECLCVCVCFSFPGCFWGCSNDP